MDCSRFQPGNHHGSLVGAITGNADYLGKACLVNGQMIGVPSCYSFGIEVDHVDGYKGIMVGDQSCGWSAYNI